MTEIPTRPMRPQIDPKLAQVVARIARQEQRSATAQLHVLIREALAARGIQVSA